jgi:hypothetical protein
MLASSDLKTVIKPKKGYMYKDQLFIQGAKLTADVKAALFITKVKKLRV